MSFLAPGWLLAGAAAAAAVIAIHLIAWRQPRPAVLPTARFVPDESRRQAARTLRLSDLPLLALRALAVLAIGAALARPVVDRGRSGSMRVILVARPAPSVASAVVDSVRALAAGIPTRVVVFDTLAVAPGDVPDVVGMLTTGAEPPPASLSVGLVAGIREARRLAREYESVEISVVASFPRESFDGATFDLRALWPGSIRVVRVAASVSPPVPAGLDVRAVGDDPVAAAVRLVAARGGLTGVVRVVRDAPTPADSAWAAGGRVLVAWRRDTSVTATPGAIHASGATAIGHVARTTIDSAGRVVARFGDGAPAAREQAIGNGCVRVIGFDVPDAGDFALRPAFQRVAAALLAPCGGSRAVAPAGEGELARLAAPPAVAQERAALNTATRAWSRPSAYLLALALLLVLSEWIVRRRWTGRVAAESAA